MKNTFWLNKKEGTVDIHNEENSGTFTIEELRESACHRIINCLGGLGIAQCGGCLSTFNTTCVSKFLNKKNDGE